MLTQMILSPRKVSRMGSREEPGKARDKRVCAFCGNGALTAEHVIPQWISRRTELGHLKKEVIRGRSHYLYRSSAQPDGMEARFEQRGLHVPAGELTVRVVCGGCNSGWMSQLEDDMKVIADPYLTGLSESAETKHAELLAFWATKTAMMFQFNDVQSTSFSAAQRRKVFRTRRPPHWTKVFLARFDGPLYIWPFHCGIEAALRAHGRAGQQPETMGITSLIIGRASFIVASASSEQLFHVLSRQLEVLMGSWRQLWPTTDVADDGVLSTVSESEVETLRSILSQLSS